MNKLLLEWLDVPPNLVDQTWHVVLQRPWPTWLQVLVLMALIMSAWWSYMGLRGSHVARGALGTLRLCTLLLLVWLLMGPAI